jgi:ATP-dependent RNA helicase DDX27
VVDDSDVENEDEQKRDTAATGDEDDTSEFGDLREQGGEDDLLASSAEDDENEVVSHNDSVEEQEEDSFDDSSDDSDIETQAEKDRKAAFFASDTTPFEQHTSFLSMNLSRPILKALTSLGFNVPTPIQAATIPVALLGKDVVGNAVTGSGKTAAFIIPTIERLLYRDRSKRAAATRCLILVPTRELGVQCYEVGIKLSAHTDIGFCLAVGELSSERIFGYY